MNLARLRWILLGLAVVGAALLGWTLREARLQSRSVRDSLTRQATVLAGSLGPGLVAASHAARDLEELIFWKLLDNARTFAELRGRDAPRERLELLAESNGLDSVVFYGPDRRALLTLGEPPPDRIEVQLEDLFEGSSDELILGSTLHEGVEHLGAAVAGPHGTVVLVRIHSGSARTFTEHLGVPSLLADLVGTGGVLYLSYRHEPGPHFIESSWDGGPVPEPPGDRELRTIRGRPTYEVELPIESPAGNRASLRVGLDGMDLEEAAQAALRRSLLVGLVLLGFAGLVWTMAVMVRRQALEREEARRRVALAEAERRRSERLAAAGALAAGLAHEVRSPLNAIGLAAQRLERKLEPGDDRHRCAQRIATQVGRLEGVLRGFLELSNPSSQERRTIALQELARETVELMRDEASSRGVELSLSADEVRAEVDPDSIHRALLNLVRNSVLASSPGDEVRVLVGRENGRCTLRVLDRGPGIDEELLGRIFDPFVTSRRDGTGLGLTQVRRVAEEHGGTVRLETRQGGGVTAPLLLPGEER